MGNYVCSTITDDTSQINRYSRSSNFAEKVGSVRCGSGDLLTGWGRGSSTISAQCAQRREGYEPIPGNQAACEWEAAINGHAPSSGGNNVNCGRICDSRDDCNSFTICGQTCFFTA